ncbi:STAS domain-containing protein [Pseudoruegeria sp. HB172150]|uniref:STAS domain-containing protein n=1 Tax=Pseudoruegeria sp. HB172150 TaxID=2721164 RepID=UPI001553240C|nr:STAS domain-containing protein [Pseudoruegeria sp. HB172150]
MAGNEDTTLLQLPSKLKGAEATGLMNTLKERRGRPVALDFAPVTQIGAQCLQVLLAAKLAWQSDGVHFEIQNMSGDIRDGLRICGLNPSQVGAKEAQNDT